MSTQGARVLSPSAHEELINALTHGIAALVCIGAGAVMITLAAQRGNMYQVISASVFCSALLLLLGASTLYHAVTHEVAKRRLKVLDHCAIYLLIAGTYTPFMLVSLQGFWGWSLFYLIWSLAAAGLVFKLFFTGRFKLVSTIIYLIMGWLVIVAVKPMWHALDATALGLIVAGGLAYTIGAAFYLAKSMRYAHAIWHLFVVIGATCHFIAVFGQVTRSLP